MFGYKKCVFDKGGIGYKPNLKQKYYKNYFVNATSINDQIVCHYCNKNGHMSYGCSVKKNAYYRIKYIWVSKGTITNAQGSKKLWVPKTLDFFYRIQRRKRTNSTWTADARDI